MLTLHQIVYIPALVFSITACLSAAAIALAEWQARPRPVAAKAPGPVLVHDRAVRTLIRSRGTAAMRVARPQVRVVYNGG